MVRVRKQYKYLLSSVNMYVFPYLVDERTRQFHKALKLTPYFALGGLDVRDEAVWSSDSRQIAVLKEFGRISELPRTLAGKHGHRGNKRDPEGTSFQNVNQ